MKVALKKAKPAPVVKERSPTPVPVKKIVKPKKKVPVYESEESEESEESSEDKYIKKATRKIQVVNSIEERLRQNAIPRNKYSNLSIFS